MRTLVFIHGRNQQGKDAVKMKQDWLDALRDGLAAQGLTLPIPETQVRFPYYGDTLHGLVSGVAPDQVAKVIVRGEEGGGPEEAAFIVGVLEEAARERGVTDAEVRAAGEAALAADPAASGVQVIERGPLNWGWVQGLLSAIDRHTPGTSGRILAAVARDAHRYITGAGVRDAIDTGVVQALTPGGEAVVVAHSLGSVVAYSLLRREGEREGWKVPLLVTLGSPLGISPFKRPLSPLKHPACVRRWFNAMDPDDVVPLHPLDATHFGVEPPIVNKTDVENGRDDPHDVLAYLRDPDVAREIHDALAG
jgi:hypothetical protein